MIPCFLCWVARDLWILYAIMVYVAMRQPIHASKGLSWSFYLRILRIIMCIVALWHLAMMYGWSEGCLSADLMRLHGGIWYYLAYFNVRDCASEPILWGWLSMPVLMIGVYIFWEYLDLLRKRKESMRREKHV